MILYYDDTGQKQPSLDYARRCIGDYIGAGGDFKVDFYTGEFGKPYVESILINGNKYPSPIHFSISHSGSLLICLVAEFNVGADCQFIGAYDGKREIAARFFSPEENGYLSRYSENNAYTRAFTEVWALKEAYTKYTGKGLSEGLTKFSVAGSNGLVKTLRGARLTLLPELCGCAVAVCYEDISKKDIKIEVKRHV